MFPFAGIIDKEYLPCGPSAERWLAIEPIPVFLYRIYLTQNQVFVTQLFVTDKWHAEDDDYIHVAKLRDILYLYNGHHRAVKAALRGELAMQARVCVLD